MSGAVAGMMLAGGSTVPPGPSLPTPVYWQGTNASLTNTASIAFTADPGTVIVLFSGVEYSVTRSIVSISGLSLSWFYRSSFNMTQDGGYVQHQEVWYAKNTSGSTIVGTITVNYDGIFDDQAMVVSSFANCNQTDPWSPSPATWAQQDGTSGFPPVFSMTIPANCTALAFFGTNGADTITNFSTVYPAGDWTVLFGQSNGGGTYFEQIATSYSQFSNFGGGFGGTITVTADAVVNYPWLIYGDALVGP